MNITEIPTKILILHESLEAGEKLQSTLKGTQNYDITLLHTKDELDKIDDSNNWKVVISRPNFVDLNSQEIIKWVKKLNPNIETIIITDHYDPELSEKIITEGAAEIVPISNSKQLQESIYRASRIQQQLHKITELESQIQDAHNRISLLAETSPIPIAYISNNKHIYTNQSYLEQFHYDSLKDIKNVCLTNLLSLQDENEFQTLISSLESGKKTQVFIDCRGKAKNEIIFPIHACLSKTTYNKQSCIEVIIQTDAKTAQECPIQDQSGYKPQLQIATEEEFTHQIQDQCSQDQIGVGKARFALLYIQLDHFKEISGQHGESGKNSVIKQISELLKKKKPKNSLLGHLKENRYAILFQIKNGGQAVNFAEKLRTNIEEFLPEVDSQTVRVTASIGISLHDKESPSGKEMLQNARQAVIDISQSTIPNNRIKLFHKPYKNLSRNDNNELENELSFKELQHLLDDNNLQLLYQPIINLRGKKQDFYETLLRVPKDVMNLAPINLFDAAADYHLANKVDRWVILNSIKRLTKLHADKKYVKLIINLHYQSILDESLLPWLRLVFQAAHLKKDSVVFQINEPDAQRYLKVLIEFSKMLTKLDCSLSISHFGCTKEGSSLLDFLPIRYVKLSPIYHEELIKAHNSNEFKKLLNELQSTNIVTIAPYVESARILSSLWHLGVDYIQGYYLQAPMEEMSFNFSEND